MVNIARVRTVIDGFPGGPGVSTMYCLDPPTFMAHLKDLWVGLLAQMPGDIVVTYPTDGDFIDPLNGHLVSSWTVPAMAGDHGSGTIAYASPVGACINWLTGGVQDGHRVKGRTFVVPLSGNAYDQQGNIVDSSLAGLRNISSAVVAGWAGNFVVWHRPRTVATVKHPIHAGGYDAVTSSKVTNKVAVLRSRRAA